jgi:vacuolar protein sorting-associated protein 8
MQGVFPPATIHLQYKYVPSLICFEETYLQGSEATLSAQTTPSKLNGFGYLSPARAFSPSRRFDIRQHQRLSSYSSMISQGSPSPSSLHSRISSISSNIADITDITPSDSPHVQWEVVRWTKLKRIEGQAFSEVGKRKFGSPTAMAVFSSPVLVLI